MADHLHRRHLTRPSARRASRSRRWSRSPASPRSSTAGSRPCTRRSTPACWAGATCPSTGPRWRHHKIEPIDLLAVNLYPVPRDGRQAERELRGRDREHRRRRPGDAPLRRQESRIGGGGGGPDRLRVGAPDAPGGHASRTECRRQLAAKVFSHTSNYDAAIARYLIPREDGLPSQITVTVEKVMGLRYGENPRQRAALYATDEPRGHPRPEAAPGQGALLQQPARSRRRDERRGALADPPRLRRDQAHHALRPGRRRRPPTRRPARPSPATGSRPSAGSWPSTPWWMPGPPRRWTSSSSRWWWRPRSTTRRWRSSPGRRTSASSSCRSATASMALDVKRIRGGFLLQDRFILRALRERSGRSSPPGRRPTRSGTTSASPGRAVASGQVQRRAAGPRRDDHRHRGRADEPGGQLVPRGAQGPPAGPRPRRAR